MCAHHQLRIFAYLRTGSCTAAPAFRQICILAQKGCTRKALPARNTARPQGRRRCPVPEDKSETRQRSDTILNS